MINYKEIDSIIRTYSEKYRHPSLPEIRISKLYDLYPEKETIHKEEIDASWPKGIYPFCGNSGVYLFLDEKLTITYVGLAIGFGSRLGQYFKKAKDGSCIVKDTRIGIPRFIAAIAVPDETWFEAAALEKYLIALTKPEFNRIGK